jgi:hypothetical protein
MNIPRTDFIDEKAELVTDPRTDRALTASVPGHGSFTVSGEAVAMIAVFGGMLHCYQTEGGCRRQGLYFSRSEPKKFLRCLINDPDKESRQGREAADGEEIVISVSRELASKLDGAVLDFGSYNKMQRFVWLDIPGIKGPACTCRRSIGPPAGKRSPCLDDRGIGLSDL